MPEAVDAFDHDGRPTPGLIVALLIALTGLCCALVGFAANQTTFIVTGSIVGVSGCIAVNGLAEAMIRWRLRSTEP
jgi:NAD/NADP transhydrogenase beta subunit